MLPQVYKTARAQIDLSKQKIVCSDSILLPHTTKIKPLQYFQKGQNKFLVVFFSVINHYFPIFPFLFSFSLLFIDPLLLSHGLYRVMY